MTRVPMLAFAMMIVTAPMLRAQRVNDSRLGFASSRGDIPANEVRIAAAPGDSLSFTAMALSGVAFAAAGIAAGGLAGYALMPCGPDTWFCREIGAILGALIVESVTTPIGVHLVHKKGSLRRELLVSAAYTLVLTTIGAATVQYTKGVPILLIPVAHIIHTIAIEHRAAHRALDRR